MFSGLGAEMSMFLKPIWSAAAMDNPIEHVLPLPLPLVTEMFLIPPSCLKLT